MTQDNISLMQAYLRSQGERARANKQKLDWFWEQSDERAELIDDGSHPLLDDNEPQYSRAVCNRAFATWTQLGNKNSIKFMCDYYHMLEKMGENSPPHVREYVKRSLATPAAFLDNPDQIFAQVRAQRVNNAGSTLQLNHSLQAPPFCRHQHIDSNHLRTQITIQSDANRNMTYYNPNRNIQENSGKNFTGEIYPGYNSDYVRNYGNNGFGQSKTAVNSANPKMIGINQGMMGINQRQAFVNETVNTVDLSQNDVSKAIKEVKNGLGVNVAFQSEPKMTVASLAMQLFSPSENDRDNNKGGSNEYVQSSDVLDENTANLKMRSQVSVDSTPERASETDSCYQSMTSPLTDLEE